MALLRPLDRTALDRIGLNWTGVVVEGHVPSDRVTPVCVSDAQTSQTDTLYDTQHECPHSCSHL